ncbi:hypothetical protein A2U01_0113165 [Trifolium medium]|uniref:Uncharacterized protein n=1 Tax=Trifolium medium TaxID=97028 RepID=A0A392VZI2_9FABA|nr:hypothetical protein [Trifolium medium]
MHNGENDPKIPWCRTINSALKNEVPWDQPRGGYNIRRFKSLQTIPMDNRKQSPHYGVPQHGDP